MPSSEFEIKPVSRDDLSRVMQLESEGFTEDESASLEMLKYRHNEAPELFLGYFSKAGELIGYICATRYHGKEITEDSMKMHIPYGASVCVHSVVVDRRHRRQGIALQMLENFVERVKEEQRAAERILLISKSQLIPLYTRAGFVLRGRSPVVHGKDPWYELSIDLKRCATTEG